ncbi:hypothetical protein ACPYO6_08310 [Georgenia sp. Z1344]|uniref:hypothetical protein n=1 Tax=Georgenia sp. Z1344 TaxID=3416706 RepID=UPI003CF82D57
MTVPPVPRPRTRRAAVVAAAIAALLLPACAGADEGSAGGDGGATAPGTGGSTAPGTGGSSAPGTGGASGLPAPYGEPVMSRIALEPRCEGGTATDRPETQISLPDAPRGADGRTAMPSTATASTRRADSAVHAVRAVHAAHATSPRTFIPPADGVVEQVAVDVVSPPTDPVLELVITLTGPGGEPRYEAETARIWFRPANDEGPNRGFVVVDGEIVDPVPFDKPLVVSPAGGTTRIEVAPYGCPTDPPPPTTAGDPSPVLIAEPLPDGDYLMVVEGTAEPVERQDDDPGLYTSWAVEPMPVTVTDGVVSGVGYDGPNAEEEQG